MKRGSFNSQAYRDCGLGQPLFIGSSCGWSFSFPARRFFALPASGLTGLLHTEGFWSPSRISTFDFRLSLKRKKKKSKPSGFSLLRSDRSAGSLLAEPDPLSKFMFVKLSLLQGRVTQFRR